MEHFFEIRGVLEEKWVSMAMVAMEGKALTWFRWWEETTTIQTWTVFKDVIIRRFQPKLVHNPFEILLEVRQEGSMKEFREIFEMYFELLKIMEHKYLFGLFLNGLKDEVRAELKLHSFRILEELTDMEEMVESRNKMLQKGC